MAEIFKDIKGYEGLYQVSNLGNVKSLNYRRTSKERILSPKLTKNGYLVVNLFKDGKIKDYYIHRLVAEAFIPNPFKLPCVNHKSEDKQANFVENLEWCSYSYNNTYNGIRKKAGEKLSKAVYCVEINRVFTSTCEAERQTGISDGNIRSVLKGIRKSAGGYHWTYV